MSELIIVDGYNIIGAWPELKRLGEDDLEGARDRLIDMLADYGAYNGMEVLVVFDAHQVPGLGGKTLKQHVHVLFTKEKETADELIERLVVEMGKGDRTIYVATSDQVEQHVTFGKGALRIPARELLLNVLSSRKEIGEKTKSSSNKSGNSFDSKLSGDVREKMEKWRRGQSF